MFKESDDITVKVFINSNSTTYACGDTVAGVVEVVTNKTIDCKLLSIDNCIKAYGKGDTQYKKIASLSAFEGQWQSGRYQYPFSFVIPYPHESQAPASYYGHYVNVVWCITATVNLAWGKKHKGEAPYDVVKPATNVVKLDEDINKKPTSSILPIIGLFLVVPQLLAGIATAIFGVFGHMFLNEPMTTSFVLVTAAFVIFPLVITIFIVRYLLQRGAKKKLGIMRLSVSPSNTPNHVEATLCITPKANLRVDKLSAYLIFEESATIGAGSSAITNSDENTISSTDIFSSNNMYSGEGTTLQKAETKCFDLLFSIPDPLTPTFIMSKNKLKYKIKVVARVNNKVHEWSQYLEVN